MHTPTLLLTCAVLVGCSTVAPSDGGIDVDAGRLDAGRITIVTSDDGKLSLEVSEATGVDPSTLTARRRSAPELVGRDDVLLAYELSPDGTRFSAPVTVRFRGSAGELGFFMSDAGDELVGPYVLPGVRQTDGGREPLGSPALAFELSDGGASFSGTLTHFTDVELVKPDHERFVGNLAIGFMGVGDVKYPALAPTTPIVGLRFWITKQVGIPSGLGLFDLSGTQEVTEPLGFALHGGVPIALAAGKHYAFNVIPEVSMHGGLVSGPVGSTGSTTLKANLKLGSEIHFGFIGVPELSLQATVALGLRFQGCTETRTGPGSAEAGRSVSLAMLHGIPYARTCERGRFGLFTAPTPSSTGLRDEASTNPSTFTLATTVEEMPLQIFTSTLSSLYYFSILSCGANDWGHTVCPTPATLPLEGDFVVLSTVMGGDVPLADPANRYIYSFVFDADNVSANNYRAPPRYPKDFYDDTDRWYEASWVPGGAWVLTAKTARGGTVTQVPTAARLVLSRDTIFFIAPRSEFDVPKPKWRFTAFRHKGDYGLNPPYDWNGDVEPPVGMPLFEVP